MVFPYVFAVQPDVAADLHNTPADLGTSPSKNRLCLTICAKAQQDSLEALCHTRSGPLLQNGEYI